MVEWYAVRTKLQSERRVAAWLEEKGHRTFLPIVMDGQKSETSHTILFPGYLFLKIDLTSARPADWRRIPGLQYLVGYGGEPVPIPDYVIRTVAHQMAGDSATGNVAREFQKGDLVRVKEGQFQDLLGVFEAHLSSHDRVRILLEAMQRSIRVVVHPDSLEKVTDDPDAHEKRKRPRRTRGRGRPIRRS